jgi:subtilisin family serine protease
VAPDASLVVRPCDSTSQCQTAGTNAILAGARSLNLSHGLGGTPVLAPNSHDRFYDARVFLDWVTVVKSAGNRGDTGCEGTDGRITHPGLGYNVITVGGYRHLSNPFSMNSCSSWRNPSSTNGDREKPEIVAPGHTISTPDTSNNFTGESGTSLAAPFVTGTAALLMNSARVLDHPFWLEDYPEVVKAILLASATTNIEGSAWRSDKDGLGAFSTLRAVQIEQGTNGAYASRYNTNCGSTPNENFDQIQTVLHANRLTRVVLTWNQDTGYSSYASRPSSDLDLTVYRDQTYEIGSLGYDNTYEAVLFTPSVSATYTFIHVQGTSVALRHASWVVCPSMVSGAVVAPAG